MAEGKKSFVLYADLIHTVKKLPNEKAGELFKHILEYVNDKDPKTDDLLISISFEPIKQQLKRDLTKWGKEKQNKSDAGVIGNLKRWYPDLYKKYKLDPGSLNELLTIAKNRKESQGDAEIAVSVNDSVSVNVSVNDNEINITEEVEFSEDDLKFQQFLCDRFNIKQMNQPRQFMNVGQAIIFMKNKGTEQDRWFRDQCFRYFKYKELANEKQHNSINTFLFDTNEDDYEQRLMSGGWNQSNWGQLGEKISKSKYFTQDVSEEDIQNAY